VFYSDRVSTADLLNQLADVYEGDVESAFRVLPKLITGMDVDPRFESHDAFEMSEEIQVVRDFGIRVYHGWLPRMGEPAYDQLMKLANYESAVGAALSGDELVREFLEHNSTQLTGYGLETLQSAIAPGELSILFRNNHFATLYKHPESGQCFILVTDAGVKNSENSDAVWESLHSVQGGDNEFFTADFSPIGFHDTSPIDPDFELAMQLQDEQDQFAARSRRRSKAPDTKPTQACIKPTPPPKDPPSIRQTRNPPVEQKKGKGCILM